MSKRKLVIGLVFDDSLDRPDGVQQQVRLIGDWLSRRGHEVHYVVGETKTYRPPVGTLHSLSKNVRIKANQNSLSLPLPVSRQRIRRLFDEHRFDMLHVMLPYSPWLGRSVIREALERNMGLIGTFHTYPASSWQRAGSKLYGWLIRRTLQRFDAVLSVSKPTADYVQRFFGVTSEIVPNAIDLDRFARAKADPGLKAGARYLIVYMNRLDERKGAKYLVLATAVLPPEVRKQVRVLVCGRGPLKAELEALIRQHDLADRITLAGFIAEEDKARYLASADLAVYPATGGEAFGIVLLEAMASGAVTLGGDNPGYRSVLSPAPESLFTPADIDGLARKISVLLRDGAKRKTLSLQQAALVKRYDIDTVGRRLEELYTKAIAGRRRI